MKRKHVFKCLNISNEALITPDHCIKSTDCWCPCRTSALSLLRFRTDHGEHQGVNVGQVDPKASHLCLVTTGRLDGAARDPRAARVGWGDECRALCLTPTDLSAAIYRSWVQACAVPDRLTFSLASGGFFQTIRPLVAGIQSGCWCREYLEYEINIQNREKDGQR